MTNIMNVIRMIYMTRMINRLHMMDTMNTVKMNINNTMYIIRLTNLLQVNRTVITTTASHAVIIMNIMNMKNPLGMMAYCGYGEYVVDTEDSRRPIDSDEYHEYDQNHVDHAYHEPNGYSARNECTANFISHTRVFFGGGSYLYNRGGRERLAARRRRPVSLQPIEAGE